MIYQGKQPRCSVQHMQLMRDEQVPPEKGL